MSSSASPLAPVLGRAGTGAEALFRTVLRTWGGPSPAVTGLVPGATDRVLVVAPHPDDEAAGCAGTLLEHRAAGGETRVVVVTDGGRSRSLGLDEGAMAEHRRREAEAAAGLLGASLVWLGFPEEFRDGDGLSQALRQALDDFGPTIVYAPSRIDYHPVHLQAAVALGAALDGLALRVRVYQVHVPLARPLVNVVADVSAHTGAIQATLRAHASQWVSLERTLRLRRYAAARYRIGGLAEEFRETSSTRYAGAHAAAPPVPSSAFRGLRYRPFADPLAYIKGRRARRMFRRAEDSLP